MSINQTLQHKRSTTAGNIPSTSQVAVGELAINLADRSIYTKNAAGVIIELAADVLTGAAFLGTPNTGDMWYNTTTDILSAWDGATWVPVSATGRSVLPANTTSRVGFSGGSGTQASPYTFSASAAVGTTVVIDTITVTGLNAGQYVPIVDLNAATNGGRFTANNNFADNTGVLMFTITFTDSPASAPSTVYTAAFQVGTSTVYINPAVTAVAVFPQSVNQPTNTVATSTAWTAPANTLTSTGQMLISLDNVVYGTGPLAITTGATLWMRWNGNAGSGVGIDGAHGTTIVGAVVSSNGATSPASLTIDKTPAAIVFTAQTGVAQSTVITSNSVTISGVNSYVYLTSANTMTASVAGGTFTSVPASSTSLVILNGQTLEVRQTSSATGSTTTTVTISANGITSAFAVTTLAAGVNTPTITTPTAGATGISPTATITASAYAVTGTVGTHLNSDWEIYSNAGLTTLVTSSMASTTNLTTWTPSGLNNSTQFWVQVRYRSSDGLVSSWSPSRNWTTTVSPGINWTVRNSGETVGLWDVTWGNSQFVVVGNSGKILTSPDGVTWTPQISGLTASTVISAVTWSGSLFVAVTTNGRTIRSMDGVNWTISSLGSLPLYGIIWAGNQFVTVGSFGRIYTSPDAVTWTQQINGTSTYYLKGVAWNGSLFVAVGDGGIILTSPDSVTWTLSTTLATSTLRDVVWDGAQFIIVGGVTSTGAIFTSSDGFNWTSRTNSSTGVLGDVAKGPLFVAVGGFFNQQIQTSPDSVTWTTRSSSTTTSLGGVSWNGTSFVTVGDTGTILTSP